MLRWELLSHSTFPFDLPVCPVQKRDDLGEWPRTTIHLFQMYLLFQMWYLSWRKKKKNHTAPDTIHSWCFGNYQEFALIQ